MAGCGECPDQCSCVIVNQCGESYPGAGTAATPIIIPERYDYPWIGRSTDGSISVTPGDVRNPVDCSTSDGHTPDLKVNFCALINSGELEYGDILAIDDNDANCRPHRLRDPNAGEVLTRDPDSGKAGWRGGVASFGGDVPYGIVLEYWGSHTNIPEGYTLCDGKLLPIADNLKLFTAIGHNANGGVDPGSGMFRVPDRRGRVAAGLDNMGGTPANRVTHANADVIGGSLGAESLTISISDMPAHNHGITGAGTSGVSLSGSGSTANQLTGVTATQVGHYHEAGSARDSYFASVEKIDITGSSPQWQGLSYTADQQMRVVSHAYLKSAGPPAQYGREINFRQATSTDAPVITISDPQHYHLFNMSGVSATANVIDIGGKLTVGNRGDNGSILADRKLQPTVFANFIMRIG